MPLAWRVSTPKAEIKSPFARTGRDQVEALAMAILMAIALKYFILEAFQIPTPSMQPVLMGSVATGIHDRILVDKAAYVNADPQRWHVAVFRYPHNQSQNYVKRIVGMPGETLRIYNGDIYRRTVVDGKAPTWVAVAKPAGLQRHLWRTLWEQDGEATQAIARRFRTSNPVGGKWKVDADGTLRAQSSGAGATRVSGIIDPKPNNSYSDGYPASIQETIEREGASGESLVVADLSWSTELLVEDGTKSVELRCFESSGGRGARVWRLRLSRQDATTAIPTLDFFARDTDLRTGKAPTHSAKGEAISFSPGSTISLELANWDDQCWASVDGQDLGPLAYRSALEATQSISLDLLVEGTAAFRSTRFARDNTYERPVDQRGRYIDTPVEIPDDHFWMLGDNQRNSDDGRTWQRMKLWHDEDMNLVEPGKGTAIAGNARFEYENKPNELGVDENPVVVPIRDKIVFSDLYGEEHVLHGKPEKLLTRGSNWRVENQGENARFVPRRFFLGRALATFYPFSRMGLIR